MHNSRIFNAKLAELDLMMGWIREKIQPLLSPSQANKFEVAIEEALVNVILYAYKDVPGLVYLFYKQDKDAIHIIIKDGGISFNPLCHIPVRKHYKTLEEKQNGGGLGLLFMNQMTDKLDYRREGDLNVLTLSKAV